MMSSKTFLLIFTTFVVCHCSFWNEIPRRCVYDRTTLLSCWNTTFNQSIPLFNDLSYTLQNHQVQIENSIFYLSLNDLFAKVAEHIAYLKLCNNQFSSDIKIQRLYFRVLQTLEIHNELGIEWFQLKSSYFPQLIRLDLSNNNFTSKTNFNFSQQYFPLLKSLNFSHNQLSTLDNFHGNIFHRVESLDLSFNPLQTIQTKLNEFSSLIYLDLSSTLIKQLIPIHLLPHLEILNLRQCSQIPIEQYETMFDNCSKDLQLDLSQTKVNSLKYFERRCVKNLILIENSFENRINDFQSTENLESIQINSIDEINSISLNIYDRLKSIDFSLNFNLKRVDFHLQSNYVYLQRLIISYTSLKNIILDFNQTNLQFLHIDFIDLSHNRLETIDFIEQLTFSSLDLSFNLLKIIDINPISFRSGMHELISMNFLNLSSNSLEYVNIHWNNESPHVVDLSKNSLETVYLHGQTTYTLILNENFNLTLDPMKFSLNLPFLTSLYMNSIALKSFEYLIYIHNLTNLRTLELNHNQLDKQSRILNWNIFYPWHRNLTHISLRNMSIERIDKGVYLNDYYHLLTVNLFDNRVSCDCILHPFIVWLQVPPPMLPDFYEPLKKDLYLDCPISILNDECDSRSVKSIILISIAVTLILVLCLVIFAFWLRKRQSSKSYDRMLTVGGDDHDDDVIALNETSTNSEK